MITCDLCGKEIKEAPYFQARRCYHKTRDVARVAYEFILHYECENIFYAIEERELKNAAERIRQEFALRQGRSEE